MCYLSERIEGTSPVHLEIPIDETTPPKRPKGHSLFGYDKPAIPGPGRPKLSQTEKHIRQFIRAELQKIARKAVSVLDDALVEKKAADRIRACEIILSHSLPKQEEVEVQDARPLETLTDEQLAAVLSQLAAAHEDANANGHSGRNGGAA